MQLSSLWISFLLCCCSIPFCLFLIFLRLSFILVLCIVLLSEPASGFTSTPFHPSSSTQRVPLPLHPHPTTLRTRCQGSGGVSFSLAEVHQELQMLQRQLGDNDSALVGLSMHECVKILKLIVCLKLNYTCSLTDFQENKIITDKNIWWNSLNFYCAVTHSIG